MTTSRRIPGLYRRGRIFWCKYYVNGRPIRESTQTEKETEAKRFLDARKGRVAVGQPILPRADRVRYEEIAKDLRQHYQPRASETWTKSSFGWRILTPSSRAGALPRSAHRRRPRMWPSARPRVSRTGR